MTLGFSSGFLADEGGAVSSDWVVLTAFMVGLCIAIYLTLGNDTHDYGELLGTTMSSRGIVEY